MQVITFEFRASLARASVQHQNRFSFNRARHYTKCYVTIYSFVVLNLRVLGVYQYGVRGTEAGLPASDEIRRD